MKPNTRRRYARGGLWMWRLYELSRVWIWLVRTHHMKCVFFLCRAVLSSHVCMNLLPGVSFHVFFVSGSFLNLIIFSWFFFFRWWRGADDGARLRTGLWCRPIVVSSADFELERWFFLSRARARVGEEVLLHRLRRRPQRRSFGYCGVVRSTVYSRELQRESVLLFIVIFVEDFFLLMPSEFFFSYIYYTYVLLWWLQRLSASSPSTAHR